MAFNIDSMNTDKLGRHKSWTLWNILKDLNKLKYFSTDSSNGNTFRDETPSKICMKYSKDGSSCFSHTFKNVCALAYFDSSTF